MNPYKKLRQLLPEPPLMLGVVHALIDGGAIVTLPDGGRLTARGDDVAEGDVVFVRNGVIESKAATMPLEVIEI